MKALMKNSDGIADKLKKGPYAEPALVPESPWLGHETPEKPDVSAKRSEGWRGRGDESAKRQRAVAMAGPRLDDQGLENVDPAGRESEQVVALPTGADARSVTVSGISRLGREGQSTRAKVSQARIMLMSADSIARLNAVATRQIAARGGGCRVCTLRRAAVCRGDDRLDVIMFKRLGVR